MIITLLSYLFSFGTIVYREQQLKHNVIMVVGAERQPEEDWHGTQKHIFSRDCRDGGRR